MKQKTIKKECTFEGAGLHTGCRVKVVCKPAAEHAGINFIRTDLPDRPKIKVDPLNIHIDTSMPRCTAIGNDGCAIYTVEHLMSVLCGLGVTNLEIEIDAKELPGLDGSGLDFLKGLEKAGIAEQDAEVKVYEIKEPLGVELNGCSIFVVPARDFKVSYTLDYNHDVLRSQFFSAVIDKDFYKKQIAPSRTFCLEEEANELRAKGLGKGADYTNTLVVGKKNVIKNKVRFPDEFARHKILDFIGDLYLLGSPIRGHVYAVKSGHTLNIKLLKRILKQKEKYERRNEYFYYDVQGKKVIEGNDIMKILPHRYPFLLVDRVLEMEGYRRAVGIKNVTVNEPFFGGHFPGQPIMPGVLILEALAQLAGTLLLRRMEYTGKLPVLWSIDKVKLRRSVIPGDQLRLEVEATKVRDTMGRVECVAKVNEHVAAEAQMVFTLVDAG